MRHTQADQYAYAYIESKRVDFHFTIYYIIVCVKPKKLIQTGIFFTTIVLFVHTITLQNNF